MRLATFTQRNSTRIGVVLGEEVLDLSAAAPELPREMRAFLAAGEPALEAARRAAEQGEPRIPLSQVKLEASVRPAKCLAMGLNYADHIAESGLPKPQFPAVFTKQVSCITGPYDPIHFPRVSHTLDYEGELAFVIGRRCRHVPVERAAEMIAGYLIMDDVSVREWQFKSPTMTLGKSFDTHGPIGPWIVTPDEIGDPHSLGIKTWVNGELRQDSNTKHLIYNCFDLVATLSTAFTLEPGDVYSTGTPGGVGIAMKPPNFLKVGDVVRVEVERIGHIENRVIAEPPDAQIL